MKKLSLIEKIAALLELSNVGKIGVFFDKQKKAAEKAIKALETNKRALVGAHEIAIDNLKDELEDAECAVEDAKTQVTPEDVKDNASMVEFAATYWARIKEAKDHVNMLNLKIERSTEAHEDEIKEIDEQIALYKERIAICVE